MPLPRITLLALTLLATACGSEARSRPIAAPHRATPGEHRVSCGPLAECADKAAELCPAGYELLEAGDSDWSQADESISRGSAERDHLLVRCSRSERAL